MSFPSPDSSTHTKSSRKRMRTGSGEKSVVKKSKRRSEKSHNSDALESSNAIQNQAVNSTQDVESKQKASGDSLSELERQLTELQRQTKNGLKLLKKYEKKKDINQKKVALFLGKMKSKLEANSSFPDLKPLTEYLTNPELLHKELFKIISKRDFKKMLPRILKKYNAREVRKLCLDEIERMSKEELLAAIENRKPNMPSLNKKEDDLGEKQGIQECNTTEKNISDNGKSNDNCNDDKNVNEESMKIHEKQDVHETENDNFDALKPVEEIKNDSEVFEEIMKIPDQLEIDELIEAENQSKNESKRVENEERENSSQEKANTENNTIGKNDAKQTVSSKSLEILELELRARALKSFIEAQERKKKQQIDEISKQEK